MPEATLSGMRPNGLMLLAARLALCSALTSSCSSKPIESRPRATTDAPASLDSAPPSAIQTALRLARAEPNITSMLAPRSEGWQSDGVWATSPGWRAAGAKRFDGIGARLPERANGTREVGLSRVARFRLRISPDGSSNSSMRELHDGRAVYVDAWPSTDVVIAATEARFEELLIVKDGGAPSSFSWRVELPNGIKAVVRGDDGGLTFTDAKGGTVVRVPPPFALDARGNRRRVEMAWRDERLVIQLDALGLTFPVLVDPAIEAGTWEKRLPPVSPPSRANGTLAYDSDRQKTVLFGGNKADLSDFGDTWEWDGSVWIEKTPALSPAARSRHALVYDKARGKTVLFGGDHGRDETWEWDGSVWLQRHPATSPPGRIDHALAYDATRSRVVLFGGDPLGGGQIGSDDTWEWDGNTWTPMTPSAKPPARNSHSLSFGPGNRTVLFGGYQQNTGSGAGNFADTWLWDGANWTQPFPATRPSAREQSVLVYDSIRKRAILFGGYSPFGTLPDPHATWEWNGTDWTETSLTGPNVPIGNGMSWMAFDEARARAVLFTGETWEYHTRGGACALNSECDTGLCVDGVCCETTCPGSCMACDTAANPGICSVVLNAADPDTCASPFACGATGICGLPKGAPCAIATLCATGLCVDGFCCDKPCSGGCDACNGATQGWSGATDGTCANAPLGFPGSPSCGGYFCSGTKAICPGAGSCTADKDCATGYFCSSSGGGTCLVQAGQGSTCSSLTDCKVAGCRECASGTCRDGYCCDVACSASCQSCSATPGTCTTVTNRDDVDTCTGASTCDKVGNCKLKNGQSCNGGTSTCASGLCSDSLCCDTSCAGGCDVCNVLPGTCTVVGAGNPGANPSCSPYLCDGISSFCPNACVTDADCPVGNYCSASGTCLEQKAQGALCDDRAGADCRGATCRVCSTGAGKCIDGYCCNATCTGACDACNGTAVGWPGAVNGTCTDAPSGYTGSPTCGAYACTGIAPTCTGSTCTADAQCGPTFYCTATHECSPRKIQGALCNAGGGADCLVSGCRVCLSNRCVDGVCCDHACGGGCDACKASAGATVDGTCTVLPQGSVGVGCGAVKCNGISASCPALNGCVQDADCTDGNYCDSVGNCQPRKPQAATCNASNECLPVGATVSGYGHCIDGFCCDVACSDGCLACAAARKANGKEDGVCGPTKFGIDSPSCAPDPQNPCGNTGVCDGQGLCQKAPENTNCGGDNYCTDNSVTGNVCGGGACVTVDRRACAPYPCQNGTCLTSCADSAQCDIGWYCVASTCVKQKTTGQACDAKDECDSGFCVDGVCCNALCAGQCQTCAKSDSVGKCTTISGQPIPPKLECDGKGPCKGTCNGGDPDRCAYPDSATSCGEANCKGDVVGLAALCDGTGACAAPKTESCKPYTCDPDARVCFTACAADSQCAAGDVCDTGIGRCTTGGNQCKDAFSIQTSNGVLTSCAPYKCAAGSCRADCVADSDCAELYACVASACVKPDDAGVDAAQPAPAAGSGCGCKLASQHQSPASAPPLFFVAAAVLEFARRRRRANFGRPPTGRLPVGPAPPHSAP